jgi:large conductance mechanosensitive channel
MLKDFKKFILRGNVVDLAVAVVIGAAFSAIISSMVKDLITPLIAAIFGKPDFSNLFFTINKSKFLYGDFVNAIISFLIIATVIFFFVVNPIYKLIAFSNRNKQPVEPGTKTCPECLSSVPIKASRCAFCSIKLVS